MPTDYQRIDAVCRKHGWTCTDEVFRHANGRHVGLKTLLAALPKGISLDILASYAEDRMWANIKQERAKPTANRSPRKRWSKSASASTTITTSTIPFHY